MFWKFCSVVARERYDIDGYDMRYTVQSITAYSQGIPTLSRRSTMYFYAQAISVSNKHVQLFKSEWLVAIKLSFLVNFIR